jgi:hypothetical protein
MLPPEIKAQVVAVLQARQIEDKAFRKVMEISKYTPEGEADLIATEYERCTRMVMRQEHALASMCIREHNQEREAAQNDSVTQ